MTTQEQKDLCIRLYTEGNHTIKDIVFMAGLRYAPDVYKILDEAGIPRKNNRKSTQTSSGRANDESREKFMRRLCRIYQGEEENPISHEEDAFKRYMWRNEKKVLENSRDPEIVKSSCLEDPRNWTEFFRSQIRAYIILWTDTKNGEKPNKWFSKYLQYKK